MNVEISQEPGLVESVCGLLTILGADGEGFHMLNGRTTNGFGEHRMHHKAGSPEWIPASILKLLEENRWALGISLPVMGRGGFDLKAVSAVSAAWSIPDVFRKSAHSLDEERLEAAYQAIAEFALPPSIVIFGGRNPTIEGDGFAVHALWAVEPISLTAPSGIERSRAVRRDLAEALGADVPDEDEDLGEVLIPLPGSVVREAPYIAAAYCELLDVERVYTVDQISSAITKGKSK